MGQFGLALDLSDRPEADIVSKKGLAQVLNVHPSRITQLIARGLPTDPNGRISIAKARAGTAANLDPSRAKILQPNGQLPRSGANGVRVELDTVRVDRARLELERARGSLVDRKAVEAAVFARARAFFAAEPLKPLASSSSLKAMRTAAKVWRAGVETPVG